jgi:hypothetical protein
MHSHTQSLRNALTTTGTFLSRAPGRNVCRPATTLFRFVRGEPHELTPGYIRYAPIDRLKALTLHTSNIQLLKGDELVVVDQLTRFLMGKVVAPLGDALMSMLQGMNGFATLWATLGQTRHLTLKPLQVFFILCHPALALNGRSVRQCGKRGQPQVYPYHPVGCGQWLRFNFTRKTGMPIADRIALNGQGFDPTLHRAVQLDLDVAYLGHKQAITLQPKTESSLFEGEAVIPTFALEPWIAWLLASLHAPKEGLERQVNPLLHTLQHL